ncbi:PLP-dependent aminotransferase family protein [uncultured Fibrobacter sp.]|uniref:MocR-like pyridoxine biosynthesis transcription factor PdxR n=1 Tax=uncultured Fibrobacter sp. TaxID=261512 RepID=UPI002805345B|nr:PLP-dependent aminotransferase family protein [uncultured Fibrobacter sp.]
MLSYDIKNAGDESLYHFLYRSIRNDILSGRLEADWKLPSKRPFASQLGVSVVTVENAYAQLLAEGFIYTQPRKGFFVSAIQSKVPAAKSPPLPESRESREEPVLLPNELVADFADNQLEVSNFPFSTWAKITRRILGERQKDLLKRSPNCGVRELREAIAQMLFDFRGLSADPEQIVVGAGSDCLYSWLVQLLGFNKKYGVEDPGYSKISKIYRKLNVVCHFIPLDENGVRIDQLEETCTDVIHISPSHHFPTGKVMPVSRRYELLGWASKSSNRYIVEDEYDSEFRMVGRPIPSMQSIDVQEKTIYINSFTKTLASTVRVSYMVLPKPLAQKFHDEFSFYTCTVSNLEQYVLAAYIGSGLYEKHINRMRNLYRGRRDFLIEAIRQSRLKDFVEIAGQDAGLHFILKVDTDMNDEEFCERLRKEGVRLRALSDYYAVSEPSHHEFVVNYSSVPQNKIPLAVQKIVEVLKLG